MIPTTSAGPSSNNEAVVPIARPALKTYARKRPNSQVNRPVPQPNYVSLLPPNNESLVGFRGLLLNMRHLKSQVHPNSLGTKTSLDRIAFEGVQHFELFADHNQGPQTSSKADALLVQRFLSMFFWPAILSVAEPNRKNDDLFTVVAASEASADINEIANEAVAAQTPFDASDIIAEAQHKAATTPKIVYKLKKQPKTVQEEPAEAEDNSAPPPLKKRKLASTSS